MKLGRSGVQLPIPHMQYLAIRVERDAIAAAHRTQRSGCAP